MAEFCNQCAIEHGFQPGEFAELCKEGEGYVLVICEGCGVIQVDHLGNCVSSDCTCAGHKKEQDND